jgi:hypothetical protein
MKIGIFGDSYACNNPLLHAKFVGEELAAEKKSWIDHIEAEKKTRVANHAMMGSSLYYSYSQFKKYQRTYDKIIFIVTDWGRLWVKNISTIHPHIPGFAHCEVKLKYADIEDSDDREILQAAYDYYVYLENHEREIDFHKLMINEILRVRSDVLLIPAFPNEGHSLVPTWSGPCLKDISDIDCHFFKVPSDGQDLKHCHFNNENNLIFAKQIINWIDHQTPLHIDLRDYQAPTKPVEYYYKNNS